MSRMRRDAVLERRVDRRVGHLLDGVAVDEDGDAADAAPRRRRGRCPSRSCRGCAAGRSRRLRLDGHRGPPGGRYRWRCGWRLASSGGETVDDGAGGDVGPGPRPRGPGSAACSRCGDGRGYSTVAPLRGRWRRRGPGAARHIVSRHPRSDAGQLLERPPVRPAGRPASRGSPRSASPSAAKCGGEPALGPGERQEVDRRCRPGGVAQSSRSAGLPCSDRRSAMRLAAARVVGEQREGARVDGELRLARRGVVGDAVLGLHGV